MAWSSEGSDGALMEPDIHQRSLRRRCSSPSKSWSHWSGPGVSPSQGPLSVGVMWTSRRIFLPERRRVNQSTSISTGPPLAAVWVRVMDGVLIIVSEAARWRSRRLLTSLVRPAAERFDASKVNVVDARRKSDAAAVCP